MWPSDVVGTLWRGAPVTRCMSISRLSLLEPGSGCRGSRSPYPNADPSAGEDAVAVDQASRVLVGHAVFERAPTSNQAQRFLDRAIRASASSPKYVITGKGKQFWCRSFRRWAKRRGIRPRYGRVGEPASCDGPPELDLP
jgi:hypothetical protein